MIRIIAADMPKPDDGKIRPGNKKPYDEIILDQTQEQQQPAAQQPGQAVPLADNDEDLEGIPVTPEQFQQLGPEWAPRDIPGLPADQYEEITPQIPQEFEEPRPVPKQPEAPEIPEEEPPFPEDEFEEIKPEVVDEEQRQLEQDNLKLSIENKIFKALSQGYPLRIIYTTLKGHTTERTIRPDYFMRARTTGNLILIAWCEMRNDWRGFIVNRIRAAKLEPKNE